LVSRGDCYKGQKVRNSLKTLCNMSNRERDKNQEKKDELALSEKELLSKGDFSFFVLKKLERLTAALYLVTNLISKEEPLRSKIRVTGLSVLSLVSHIDISFRDEEVIHLRKIISEVLGLLRVAVVGGQLSTMNYEVLTQEYHLILKLIFDKSEGDQTGKRGQRFDDNFFQVSELDKFNKGGGAPQNINGNELLWSSDVWETLHKGQFSSEYDKEYSRVSNQGEASMKLSASTTRNLHSNGQISGASSHKSRRLHIVELVKRKGRVSVKDVSDVIKDCSEKTLQRELVSLVGEGVLKKEGERRWSTYLLT